MRCPDGSVFVFSIPSMLEDCSSHNSNDCDKECIGDSCRADDKSRVHKDSVTSSCSEDCLQVPEIVIGHT